MTLIAMKSATISSKGQITIPRAAREDKFKEGTKVVILTRTNRIEILPMAEYVEMMEPAMQSEQALAKAWLSPEDEKAWKDL